MVTFWWDIYNFFGKRDHFYYYFRLTSVYYIKSTKKNLAWVRLPPFLEMSRF